MSSDGKRLLSSLVVKGSMKAYASMHLEESLFKGSEVALFTMVQNHVTSFGKLPHPDTVMSVDGLEDSLVETVEPPEYYLQAVQTRYLHSQLKEVVIQAQELLKEELPEDAYSVIAERMSGLARQKNRQHLFDFREASELILETYMTEKKDNGDYLVKFGWPTLDAMTGGIRPGDMVSFVGRPATGKTFQLLYSAHYNWDKAAHSPLFVSMEMTATVIQQRLAAMHTHKPLGGILKGMMSTLALGKMLEELEEMKTKERPLWIVDGNLSTNVDDIVMAARQLQPTAIFVDGAYLLRHPNPKVSKWDRLTENAELLKQKVATDLGIPVICSYQFNRDSTKKNKKNNDKAGVEDIYGSDAIGQLSTVVLGLFEEENVETMKARRIEVIKGRNGESGSFKIRWNFNLMDFSEIVEEDIEDLQFIG